MTPEIDFGKTAQDYGHYRAGFPEALFERLGDFGIGKVEQRVLDIGTGTGTMARGLVGRGCAVMSLDLSAPLLLQGRGIDEQSGVGVDRLIARAEEIGLADQGFEVITAGQCWHWFDRPKAAWEVRRLLMPGGRLVIAHFDWLPLPGNMVEATEQLILKHNPTWHLGGGNGMYPAWLTDVATAGFQNIETFSFDLPTPYSHEAWRGRIRASAGVAASLSPPQVARFDAELKSLLATHFAEDPLQVPHRVFAVVCVSPSK
ncbi:MAG: class I SAM-dependent methyltransferase [Anaerolineae bacterium]